MDEQRVRWLCRRGMKELDVLLERYLEARWPHAGDTERAAFVALLELQDPELWASIAAHSAAPTIAAHSAAPTSRPGTRRSDATRRDYSGAMAPLPQAGTEAVRDVIERIRSLSGV